MGCIMFRKIQSAILSSLKQTLLFRICSINIVITIFDSCVSCEVGGSGSYNLRCVSDNLVVKSHGWHNNIAHDSRLRTDRDISCGYSETIDVISYITCALHNAISVYVGISTACHTVKSLGFDLGRGSSGVSVAILAQGVLCVVLVTGGRVCSGWGNYSSHIHYRNLGVRYDNIKRQLNRASINRLTANSRNSTEDGVSCDVKCFRYFNNIIVDTIKLIFNW